MFGSSVCPPQHHLAPATTPRPRPQHRDQRACTPSHAQRAAASSTSNSPSSNNPSSSAGPQAAVAGCDGLGLGLIFACASVASTDAASFTSSNLRSRFSTAAPEDARLRASIARLWQASPFTTTATTPITIVGRRPPEQCLARASAPLHGLLILPLEATNPTDTRSWLRAERQHCLLAFPRARAPETRFPFSLWLDSLSLHFFITPCHKCLLVNHSNSPPLSSSPTPSPSFHAESNKLGAMGSPFTDEENVSKIWSN